MRDDHDEVRLAFIDKDTGERFEGDSDDVFGLVWLEDGELRVSSLGRLPPDAAREQEAT